jgi:hypothetical protein
VGTRGGYYTDDRDFVCVNELGRLCQCAGSLVSMSGIARVNLWGRSFIARWIPKINGKHGIGDCPCT